MRGTPKVRDMAASNSQSFPSNPPLSATQELPVYWQERGISQEWKDLMSTLPTAKGWIPGMLIYQYQGHWYARQILESTLNFKKHFEPHDTDIILVTPPKSGTTWLKALTYALVNREKYSINKNNDHPLLIKNPHDLVPFLERNLYLDTPSPDLSSLSSPRILATHVPLVSFPESIKNSNCKIVYLSRDIKDTFVSSWHFANKLRPHHMEPLSLGEAFDMFCDGILPYGPLWDHIYEGMKASSKNPENILFLKYEELNEQPHNHLKHLAEFIGYPFSVEEEKAGVVEEIIKLCSFDSLANLGVNKNGTLSTGYNNNTYFRKGHVGDWKNYLTPEMASRVDQIVEQKSG